MALAGGTTGGASMCSTGGIGSGIGGPSIGTSVSASAGMGAGVVNYQISQQLSTLKKSTQHCQVHSTFYRNMTLLPL